MDERRLARSVGDAFATLEVHDELGSTNRRALELGAAMPALVACREQTKGRGRAGRKWKSSGKNSVTFSVAYPLRGKNPTGLSMAAAVGAAEALARLGLEARLKWPNDLIGPAGGKLGGILVEVAGDVAAVGVGVNLFWFEGLAAEPNAESLDGQQADVEQNEVAATLALGVLAALDRWKEGGMAAMRRDWLRQTVHHAGDPIMVTGDDGDKRRMEFLGIGKSGELLARDDGGKERAIVNAHVEP